MIKDIISDNIRQIIPGFSEKYLLYPNRSNLGDYAFYVKTFEKSVKPQTVLSHLSSNPLFAEVTIINGFANLFISPKGLLQNINDLFNPSTYRSKKTQTILFEFGDPNTHKLPHIGHFFSYFFGEASSRLLEANGHKVYRANYQGDVGLHVAKALYIYKQKKEKINTEDLEKFVRFLQTCYQEGSKIYEQDIQARKNIDELNKLIYQKDSSVYKDWKITREANLRYYRNLEKQFDITYDRFYYESETFHRGLKIVYDNIGKIFEKSDEAIIFNAKPYGLHTRVFINKHGNPTYEAKDIGLIEAKMNDFIFDLAIIDTASEQNEYWKVVKKAIELIFPKTLNKIVHLGHGMISLKSGGKMSSRTGNILSAIDLIKEIRKRIQNTYYTDKKITNNDLDILTFASLKYAFLKSDWKKNILFDIDESINLHGNSGIYLLYTFVRCQSILAKSNEIKTTNKENVDIRVLGKYETIILRHLLHYQETLSQAAQSYTPHQVCTFLFQLAQKYNNLYEHESILQAKKENQMLRLYLTQAVSHVLKHGLHILGIQTVENL